MANLSELMGEDPTLKAIERALEERSRLDPKRGRAVTMGQIGETCKRKTWYRFRHAAREVFDAETLKRFEDGHLQEKVQAERLRMVPAINLITEGIDGKQIEYIDLNGHFKGRVDGLIYGLLQAPIAPHIWEHKAVGDKKLTELTKLKAKDEKTALKNWNMIYYAQAVLYMHYQEYERHYMTISSAGGRETISVRTDADPEYAKHLIARAQAIINANEPPLKVSVDPNYWECRYCPFTDICHGDKKADINCRTCLHSSPTANGRWHCAKWEEVVSREVEVVGCNSHLYLPGLVAGEVVDAGDSWVQYKMRDGSEWVDVE